MLQLALNLNKLRDQLPRKHRGHYMILGMYQNKINRYFATALIHTDKHGLYIMRAFCGICGVLHQPVNVLPHSFSGGLQRLHRQTAGLTGVNDEFP
ncbi:Uncharacterised protein [Klebsiella pneumoniae]|uniref:Uncharacterized protein n=1 Tax=Klebsiella pneumoniae TaxID=573 RepID=A0A378B7P5_KLEPN|nr:Uncharacterised protein [Klebsiella pneumoniae]